LHVLHALLPLAPRCESIGNVLMLLMYFFRAGLGVVGSFVFYSFVGVLLTLLVIMVVTFLTILACNTTPWRFF
jgi:hypothetical protein